jgi:hypothetical protein
VIWCVDGFLHELNLYLHHMQVADVSVLGITESFRVKQQVLVSAHEAAERILRVDNILKAAPRYVCACARVPLASQTRLIAQPT